MSITTDLVVKNDTAESNTKPKSNPQCLKLNGIPIKPAPTIEFSMLAIVLGNDDFGVGKSSGGSISSGNSEDDRSVVAFGGERGASFV